MKAQASARKSNGEYKPMIKVGSNTTIVEQNPERFDKHTKFGVVKGDRYARGTTYSVRADAIAAAQRFIDARLAETLVKFEKFGQPEKMKREITLWGGEI